MIYEVRINPIASKSPGSLQTGDTQFGFSSFQSLIAEPQLAYRLSIGEGILEALIGGSWQQSISKAVFIRARGYTNDALLRSVTGASEINSTDSYGEYRYAALFGRLRYKDRKRTRLNSSH